MTSFGERRVAGSADVGVGVGGVAMIGSLAKPGGTPKSCAMRGSRMPDHPCGKRCGPSKTRNVFRIRRARLLSLCVNAIILETASSFVSPDYVCSSVYVHYSFVVYTCLQSTSPLLLYHRPYDLRLLRVPTKSLRVAHRLNITTYELPRYTTIPFPCPMCISICA